MRTIFGLMIIALLSQACFAKPPQHGDKPEIGRTSGYWAQVSRVVDGDTYWAGGIKYREMKIDTPEISDSPRHGYKCEAERRLGELAKLEAEALLLGQKVWIKPSGRWDYYDRPLVRTRFARGKWYDDHMIKLRLAAPWLGRKHKWCEMLDRDRAN